MKLLIPLITLLLTAATARAVNTIAWQKSVFDTEPMFTNSGGILDASFSFQLGTFGSLLLLLSAGLATLRRTRR